MPQPRAARSVRELLDASDQLELQSKTLNAKCAEQSRQLAAILSRSRKENLYHAQLNDWLGEYRGRGRYWE